MIIRHWSPRWNRTKSQVLKIVQEHADRTMNGILETLDREPVEDDS